MTESEAQLQAAEALLKEAQLSYVRHEEGRREPFNLFTVLRSESDEVRLHSRFLAALRDHRKAPGEPRENLKDFLATVADQWKSEADDAQRQHDEDGQQIAGQRRRETDNVGHEALKIIVECSDFKSNSIQVKREYNDIDILIANNDKGDWAIVIENKIWAGDQPQQLWRYYKSRNEQHVIVLYLSPDGQEPSEHSIYDEKKCCRVPKNKLQPISYKDTLPSWLERCRQRACDEPELRESAAQYLHLVRKLTGTDQRREYMKELKELLLKEGNNLVLAYHLNEAMHEAKAYLVHELWKDIEEALDEIEGLLTLKSEEKYNLEDISNYVRGGSAKFGLYYPFGDDHGILFAEVRSGNPDCTIVGLRFRETKNEEWLEHYVESRKLKELVEMFGGGEFGSSEEWAWYRFIGGAHALRRPTPEHLKALSNKAERARIVGNVVQPLEEAWKRLKPA